MNNEVSGDRLFFFFLPTDIKAPVSFGMTAFFFFNIPLAKEKSLLKDKSKIVLVPHFDEVGLLLLYIYWKSF